MSLITHGLFIAILMMVFGCGQDLERIVETNTVQVPVPGQCPLPPKYTPGEYCTKKHPKSCIEVNENGDIE